MPTLYVEDVPTDLYDALRNRARANRSSITAEVLSLLRENVPTADELARRAELLQFARRQARRSPRAGSGHRFPSAEEILKQDRSR